MKTTDFKPITADMLKQYINSHQEKEYVIIDVRQPQEYLAGHIPGANLIPLSEFQTKLFDLPTDKSFVFYCASGGRSRMAAMLAAEGEITEKELYNLDGGMMAWSGKTLSNMPKVKVFDKAKTLPQFLETAMNMEKGAGRFYRKISEIYATKSFSEMFKQLAIVETAHAKTIFKVYKAVLDSPLPSFEAVYEELDGDILEGGEHLSSYLDSLSLINENACLAIMELALDMEFTAFDLYRTLANMKTDEPKTADIFLNIAQAEKSHMRMIIDAVGKC